MPGIGDIIVIAIIAGAVILAVRSMMKSKKKGGCCGNCSGCSGCCNQK